MEFDDEDFIRSCSLQPGDPVGCHGNCVGCHHEMIITITDYISKEEIAHEVYNSVYLITEKPHYQPNKRFESIEV
jgi:hypothetical protein